MDQEPESAPAPLPDELGAILLNLSREIRDPLDQLQSGLDAVLDRVGPPISEVEATHARTMRTLCEDLRRLTIHCLGGSAEVIG